MGEGRKRGGGGYCLYIENEMFPRYRDENQALAGSLAIVLIAEIQVPCGGRGLLPSK